MPSKASKVTAKVSKNRIPSKTQKQISSVAMKKIADRAKVIAEEIADKELGTKPTGSGYFATPYRPRKSGKRYKDSFKVKKISEGGKTTYALTNDAKTRSTKKGQKPQRNLASIIERGSKPHGIAPANGKFLRWENTSGKLVTIIPAGTAVNHPGTKGRRIGQRALARATTEFKQGKL